MSSAPQDTLDETKITAKIPHPLYVGLKTYCAIHRKELKEVITEGMQEFLNNSKAKSAEHPKNVHQVSAVLFTQTALAQTDSASQSKALVSWT